MEANIGPSTMTGFHANQQGISILSVAKLAPTPTSPRRNLEPETCSELAIQHTSEKIVHPPRGRRPDFAILEPIPMDPDPHGIIHINNDTHFASIADAENWEGSGTSGNPYIIENYDIDSDDTGDDCILILNTRVHFIIRYCVLIGGEYAGHRFLQSGIKFYNVSNGDIVDNTAYDHGESGILLTNSSNCQVTDNTCTGNWNGGIYLGRGSHSNTVADNGCSGNDWAGIMLKGETVRNNTIVGNTLSNHHWEARNEAGILLLECEAGGNTVSFNTATDNDLGVALAESYDNTVVNNTCNNNDFCGIYLGGSEYGDGSKSNLVGNNTCNNNIVSGIHLEYRSRFNSLTTNLCDNNEHGIHLDDSNNNTLVENECSMGTYGIYVYSSDYNTLIGNKPTEVLHGIRLDGSTYSNIHSHTIHDLVCGISLTASTNNIIHDNVLISNTEVGIYLESDSESNHLEGNTCRFNHYGIYLDISHYCTLTDNVCVNSTSQGLHTRGSWDILVILNTLSNNSNYGLGIDGAEDANFTDNTFDDNGAGGIHISGWVDDCLVARNSISGGGSGIYINSADGSRYVNNTCIDCTYGIRCDTGWHNWIEENTLDCDVACIDLFDVARLNWVVDNWCTGGESGISVRSYSYQNTLENNTCTGNEKGISLDDTHTNTIENNDCMDNDIGIYVHNADSNTFVENDCSLNAMGIVLNASDNCNVLDNYCSQASGGSPSVGLLLYSTNQTTVFGNLIDSCDNGIHLNISDYARIENNTVSNNVYYAVIMDAMTNRSEVHWNIIDNNSLNEIDDGTFNDIDYNYWSAYEGTDSNGDGFGDTPYPISGSTGNEDPHPLVYLPTPPEWNPEPTDQIVECGTHFTYDLDVIATTTIRWWIDDTAHFTIDNDGVITDNELLTYGEYWIEARAYNLYNASCSATLKLTMDDTTAPEVDHPDDVTFRMNEERRITWTVSDFNPDYCCIYEGRWQETYIGWADGEATVEYWIGYVEVGWVINVTIVAFDVAGNTATDTVMVTIISATDDTPTTTTSTGPTGGGWDFSDMTTMIAIAGTASIIAVLVIVAVMKKRGS